MTPLGMVNFAVNNIVMPSLHHYCFNSFFELLGPHIFPFKHRQFALCWRNST